MPNNSKRARTPAYDSLTFAHLSVPFQVAPTRAIQFAVFERIKFMMLKHHTTADGKPRSLSPLGRLFAGTLGPIP